MPSEAKKAQKITEDQIRASREQGDYFRDLLSGTLGKRDAFLDPLLQRILLDTPGLQDIAQRFGLLAGKPLDVRETGVPDVADVEVGDLAVDDMAQISEGLSPEIKAALNAQAIDAIGPQREQALRAARAALTRSSGGIGYGGQEARMLSGVETGANNLRSSLIRDALLKGEDARRADVLTNVGIRSNNLNKNVAVGQSNLGKNVQVGGMNQAKGLELVRALLAQRGIDLDRAVKERGFDLSALTGEVGATEGALNNYQNLARTAGSIYDPSPYVGGMGNALNSAGSATNMRAQIQPKSFWSSLGQSLLSAGVGAGMGLLTGGASSFLGPLLGGDMKSLDSLPGVSHVGNAGPILRTPGFV